MRIILRESLLEGLRLPARMEHFPGVRKCMRLWRILLWEPNSLPKHERCVKRYRYAIRLWISIWKFAWLIIERTIWARLSRPKISKRIQPQNILALLITLLDIMLIRAWSIFPMFL